ncbi:hypothetical protein KAM344_30730 [Aeromonas caviae]|nr:hypothetical protein KAM359_33070 [Aeromonas caviae]GJB24732.1 hypothetical protein KAM365_24820 [Aeromonas caviae]GJB55614.1 hypothetical protein KAM373_26090 [Aeromonas caviae]GJB64229.1 hypothetical protein KAM375_22830 [Aeromonas caviae]GJB68997.1 hypothetical protein KAM378_25280 [Aeromonas caviae]
MTRSSALRGAVVRVAIITQKGRSQRTGWRDASDSVIPLFSREVLFWLESNNFLPFARGAGPNKMGRGRQ